MSAQQVARRRAIENALLDFHHKPGQHLVAFRQPVVLFDSLKDVLAMAGERSIDQDAPAPAAPLVNAAQFFVRTALLSPRSDHYALLGLPRNADAGAIKERYRVLMRLMHPDFAASADAAWPADAATRVNQAYEILSTPDKRKAYDEQLAVPISAPPSTALSTREAKKTSATHAQKAGAIDSRKALRWLATAFGAAGGLALAATWLMGSQSDRDFLVQRAITRTARAAPEVATVDAASAQSAALVPSVPASNAGNAIADEAFAAATPSASAAIAPASAPPTLDRNPVITSPAPVPAAAAAPLPEPAGQPVVVQAPAPVASPPPLAAPIIPAPTIAQVQPQLTQLLMQIETGWGDNVIDQIPERAARRSSGAQALARQIDTLFDGVRPVRVTHSEFKGETRDGRLVVTGRVQVSVRGSGTRQLAITAEFDDRNGSAVLTRLGSAQ